MAARASCTARTATRERVLDRRLVPDEGEGVARGLSDEVHGGVDVLLCARCQRTFLIVWIGNNGNSHSVD